MQIICTWLQIDNKASIPSLNFLANFRYLLSPLRLSVVCLSVCNAGAPYSGSCKLPQFFYGVWYLGHPLTRTENFMEIVPGEPLSRGVKAILFLVTF